MLVRDFQIEKVFQHFLTCFPGLTNDPQVIDLLRDFFYRGAGEIMRLQIDPPKGATDGWICDVMAKMYSEVLQYNKMKEMEHDAELN